MTSTGTRPISTNNSLSVDEILLGDCRNVLCEYPDDFFSACITDPPYNYEFIGKDWNFEEIKRRLVRVQDSNTLVKNIPYGSGLAGGVRNQRWYERNRQNILDYESWCTSWAGEVFRTLKPGAYGVVFNSTRTVAHVQVSLEKAGFYARDILVYRRHAGIPKGLNASKKLQKQGREDWEAWVGWHSCLRNEWEAVCLVQKPLLNDYLSTIKEHGVGLLHAQMNGAGFQSNILEGFSREQQEDFGVHCTVKPFELMKYLVRLTVPDVGEHVILDPFAGTGTTCAAVAACGHHYVGIDLVDEYVQVARRRMIEPVHGG